MRWAILALCLSASPLHAEIMPLAGPGDPHIQTVAYDPQQVVALHVAAGYALTVQLAADERVETVTLGDGNGWQVQVNHRADHLVIKPVGGGHTTNLTLITDQRVYNFSLYGAMPGEGVQPYIVSFVYPTVDSAPAPRPAATGRYRLRGDKALWPAEMSDDGTFTRLRWNDGVAMPAVYAQDAQGGLALVNGVMREGIYTLEGVHARLLFVSGAARASAVREKDTPQP